MKKTMFIIIMFCAFLMLPTKSLAVLLVDENGKPIERELKDDEVITMIAPDNAVSSDEGNGYAGEVPPSKSVVDGREPYNVADVPAGSGMVNATDIVLTQEGDELYRTMSIEEDAFTTTAANDNKENSIGTVLLSGSIGLLLGVTGSYLLFLKRKEQ